MVIPGASSDIRMTDALAEGQPGARWQNAKIIEIIPRTPTIKSFIFELPAPLAFRAGQHVDVRLTAPDGYRAMRSYSIASAPATSNRIELAIDLLDNGEVSPFFHQVAAVGDDIELRGPLGGHFVWSGSDGGPLLLAGGGSGVVPLMSMLRHRHVAAPMVPAILLFSARRWVDVLYREELFGLAAEGSGLEVVLALTREQPRRPKDYGRRVDSQMMTEVIKRLPSAPKYVFVCGSNPFVNAAADGIIDAGVPAAIVRTERYGA
jgi:ferredoxin-NADP reductase